MKTPRELFIEKYRHCESDLDHVAERLTRHWGSSVSNETRDAEDIMCWLVTPFKWRNYWYGLGTVWIAIGLLHALTLYQFSPPTPNQNAEWSGDLDLIMHHYATTHADELEWMDELHSIPSTPVHQQVPRSDKTPGPQGGLNNRSREERAFSWGSIPIQEHKRPLECGGLTPLWIPEGYPTSFLISPACVLSKLANLRNPPTRTGGVRGSDLEFDMVFGSADRIQSGVKPPHSRGPLSNVDRFGIC